MKRLALCLLLAACMGWAGEAPQKKQRRLENLDWNPITCELTWVVSEGHPDENGGFVKEGEPLTYSINMDKATMTYKLSTRRFATEEAQQVHGILNALASYAVQSTQWWDAGKGIKLDRQASQSLPFRGILSLAQQLETNPLRGTNPATTSGR